MTRTTYHDYIRNRRLNKKDHFLITSEGDVIDTQDWYVDQTANVLLNKARKINATGFRRLNIKASRELLLRLELDFTEESLKW